MFKLSLLLCSDAGPHKYCWIFPQKYHLKKHKRHSTHHTSCAATIVAGTFLPKNSFKKRCKQRFCLWLENLFLVFITITRLLAGLTQLQWMGNTDCSFRIFMIILMIRNGVVILLSYKAMSLKIIWFVT